MPLIKTELYFCKDCNKEIDRHLFEHWLAVHKSKAKARARIYNYYDADPAEQQEYYLWSWDNVEFSRSVSLEEEQVKALSKFDDKHVSQRPGKKIPLNVETNEPHCPLWKNSNNIQQRQQQQGEQKQQQSQQKQQQITEQRRMIRYN